MSDYSNTFGGVAKDAANSTILGADHDTEYDAIATASATKANKTGAPATTNNLAMLTATGDLADSLVESDGSGNITANVTGNLTGDVTGDVVATDITTDTLTATTTNGDLAVTRNGTGDFTIDAVPIYGMVILDTPEQLVSASATVNSWTTVNSTTLNTAGAVKAILRMSTAGTTTTGSQTIALHIRKTGSALAANNSNVIGQHTQAGVNAQTLSGEGVVNLDGSSDFDWYTRRAGSAGSYTTDVYLVGYYV